MNKHTDNLDNSSDSDIRVRSDYLPYSSETIDDNAHLENNNIEVITGNRTTCANWSNDGNLPDKWMFMSDGGWNGDANLPENWSLSNPYINQETWNVDNSLPDGWRRRNLTEEQIVV